MDVHYGHTSYLESLIAASTVEEADYAPQPTVDSISLVYNGIIIGYILYTLGEPIYIDYIAVHPDYRGCSLCRELLSLLIDLYPDANAFYLENAAGLVGCMCYINTFYDNGFYLNNFRDAKPDCNDSIVDMMFLRDFT